MLRRAAPGLISKNSEPASAMATAASPMAASVCVRASRVKGDADPDGVRPSLDDVGAAMRDVCKGRHPPARSCVTALWYEVAEGHAIGVVRQQGTRNFGRHPPTIIDLVVHRELARNHRHTPQGDLLGEPVGGVTRSADAVRAGLFKRSTQRPAADNSGA